MFSQLLVSSQFYFWGKRAFTARGWERHRRTYEQPDILAQPLDLSKRVFMVSGANSGIGKEVTKFLASKGSTVYMLCRSRGKAEEVRQQIATETSNDKATEGSRFVAVSSGGMYNVPFPSWEVATATDPKTKYDGQFAYCYAKRGQVLLCEEWARLHPDISFVSCHPGWTSTPGVDAAYGTSQKYLQPLRSSWQGAEGIIWLCVAPKEKLQSGAFYLDREPQRKHIAGLCCSEGKYTKNTPEQVDKMMSRLKEWSVGKSASQQQDENSAAAGS